MTNPGGSPPAFQFGFATPAPSSSSTASSSSPAPAFAGRAPAFRYGFGAVEPEGPPVFQFGFTSPTLSSSSTSTLSTGLGGVQGTGAAGTFFNFGAPKEAGAAGAGGFASGSLEDSGRQPPVNRVDPSAQVRDRGTLSPPEACALLGLPQPVLQKVWPAERVVMGLRVCHYLHQELCDNNILLVETSGAELREEDVVQDFRRVSHCNVSVKSETLRAELICVSLGEALVHLDLGGNQFAPGGATRFA
eukprot:CAMPEP_0177738300 /NCGR_PEP_ID=MMETSP0484_2-20121128/26378_1 /TAXON_ID=354590 /ORGANISM="Rhodomonas lens, Strain RHODO" /LENGTH=246 /DNA_ID=CAMNT_0019252205 /DNA_START=82 /DNA_END=818 /DNA_ORIENTATION=-